VYIIKVNTGDGQIVMTINEVPQQGRYSSDSVALTLIIDSFKKQFSEQSEAASLTIMDDRGNYYKPGFSQIGAPITYVQTANIFDVLVPLNTTALKELTEHKARFRDSNKK
jgi:hypothetical protein